MAEPAITTNTVGTCSINSAVRSSRELACDFLFGRKPGDIGREAFGPIVLPTQHKAFSDRMLTIKTTYEFEAFLQEQSKADLKPENKLLDMDRFGQLIQLSYGTDTHLIDSNTKALNSDIARQYFSDRIQGSTLVQLNSTGWPSNTALPTGNVQVLSSVINYYLANKSTIPEGQVRSSLP